MRLFQLLTAAGCVSLLAGPSHALSNWPVDASGAGGRLDVAADGSLDNEHLTGVASDGYYGVLIAWEHWEDVDDCRVYAQRLDPTGTPQWTGMTKWPDVTWLASSTASWINVALGGGLIGPTAATDVGMTVIPSALPVGPNTAFVTIDDVGGGNMQSAALAVVVYVYPTGGAARPDDLQFVPRRAEFEAESGSAATQEQTVWLSLDEASPNPVDWSAAATAAWLTVDETGGTINPGENQDLLVTVDPSTLGAGLYTGTVTVTDDAANVRGAVLAVTLYVGPPGPDALELRPRRLEFVAQQGSGGQSASTSLRGPAVSVFISPPLVEQTQAAVADDSLRGGYCAWADTRDDDGAGDPEKVIYLQHIDKDANHVGIFDRMDVLVSEEATILRGKLTFKSGDAVVTGAKTMFEDEVTPGSIIRPENSASWYTVASVTAQDALTLTAAVAPADAGVDRYATVVPYPVSQFSECHTPKLLAGGKGCYVAFLNGSLGLQAAGGVKVPLLQLTYVSSAGQRLWTTDIDFPHPNTEYKLYDDGAEGVLVVWHEPPFVDPGATLGEPSASFAVRINPDGEGVWGEDPVLLFRKGGVAAETYFDSREGVLWVAGPWGFRDEKQPTVADNGDYVVVNKLLTTGNWAWGEWTKGFEWDSYEKSRENTLTDPCYDDFGTDQLVAGITGDGIGGAHVLIKDDRMTDTGYDPTPLTGLLSFTDGDTTVTGDAATDFLTQIASGDYIKPAVGGVWSRVLFVSSPNDLLLFFPYAGATAAGVAAEVTPGFGQKNYHDPYQNLYAQHISPEGKINWRWGDDLIKWNDDDSGDYLKIGSDYSVSRYDYPWIEGATVERSATTGTVKDHTRAICEPWPVYNPVTGDRIASTLTSIWTEDYDAADPPQYDAIRCVQLCIFGDRTSAFDIISDLNDLQKNQFRFETVADERFGVTLIWEENGEIYAKHVNFQQMVADNRVGGFIAMGPDVFPPEPVTNFRAEGGIGEVSLTWTNPPGGEKPLEDFAGVMIRRSAETYPGTEEEGDWVYEGPDEEYVDTDVEAGKTYYYSAFCFDTEVSIRNFSGPVKAEATVDLEDVRNFQGYGIGDTVRLSWENPGGVRYAGVKILRSRTDYPATIVDGIEVGDFAATVNTHTDTGLVPGTIYYYTAFAHDDVPIYTQGVTAFAVPLQGVTIQNTEAEDRRVSMDLMMPTTEVNGFVDVIVRRSTTAYPATETEGEHAETISARGPQASKLSHDSPAPVTWTAQAITEPWLGLNAMGGTIAVGESTDIVVRADPTGLADGVHAAVVTIDGAGGVGSAALTVVLEVGLPPLKLSVAPELLAFSAPSGSTTSATRTVRLSHNATGPADWTAVAIAETWLSLASTSGTIAAGGAQDIDVTVDPTGLADGLHTALVTIDGVGSIGSAVFTVTLRVAQPASTLSLAPKRLAYSVPSGSTMPVNRTILYPFSDSPLTNDTTYYYSVFAHYVFGDPINNDVYTAPAQAAATPGDFVAPEAIQNLQATGGDGLVTLTWDMPPYGEDWTRLVIRRNKQDDPPITDPTQGNQVHEFSRPTDDPETPEDETQYDLNGQHDDDSVVNKTSYRYVAFVLDEVGNVSQPSAEALARPEDTTRPEVQSFTVMADILPPTPTSKQQPVVKVSWSVDETAASNLDLADDTPFVILRARWDAGTLPEDEADRYPDYPTDEREGITVDTIETDGKLKGQLDDTDVVVGQTYYYAAYAIDDESPALVSQPATGSVTVVDNFPPEVLLYTTSTGDLYATERYFLPDGPGTVADPPKGRDWQNRQVLLKWYVDDLNPTRHAVAYGTSEGCHFGEMVNDILVSPDDDSAQPDERTQEINGLWPGATIFFKITMTDSRGASNTDVDGEPEMDLIEVLAGGNILRTTGNVYYFTIPDPTTSPGGEDTDGDRIADAWELEHFGDLTTADAATNHDLDDSDDDGIADSWELARFGDLDTAEDTDGDRLADDWELERFGDLVTASDPAQHPDAPVPDTLSDLEEYHHQTDPTKPDTDGDGVRDDVEIANLSDPRNAPPSPIGFDEGCGAAAGGAPLAAALMILAAALHALRHGREGRAE